MSASDEREYVRRQAMTGAVAMTASTVVTRGLNFARSIALARLLAPSEFGAVAYVYTVLGCVSCLTTFRCEEVIASARHDRDRVTDVGFTAHMCVTMVRALLLLLLAPWIMGLLFRPNLTPVLRLLAVFSIGAGLKIGRAQMSQELRFWGRALPEILEAAVALVACIWLAASGCGLWTLLVGPFCGEVVYLVALYSLMPRRPRPSLDRGVLKDVFRVSLPLYLLFISVWVYWNVDDLMVGYWLGNEQLGYYYRAFQLPQHFLAMQAIIATVMLPSFAQLLGDPGRLSSAFARATRMSATAILPCAAILVPLARPTIVCIFGQKWEPSCVAFAVFVAAVVLKVVFGSATELFISLRQTRLLLYLHLPNSFLVLLLGPFAVRHYGIEGMAVATLIPLLVSVPATVFFVKRTISFSVRKAIQEPLAIACCIGVLAWFLLQYVHDLTGLILVVLGLSALYGAGVILVMGDMWRILMEMMQRTVLVGVSDSESSSGSAGSE